MPLAFQLALVLVLFTGGIFVAIRYFLFRNVTRATSHLDKLSENYTKKEEEVNRRLDEARENAGRTLADARKEAEEIKLDSSEEAQEEKERILKEARLQSEQIIQQANKTRDFLIGELNQRIEDEAVRKSCELIPEVIPDELRREVHSRRLKDLVDYGLEELGGVSLPDGAREARIISAYELTEAQRDALQDELRKKFGDDVEVRPETDPDLIAGFTIAVGGVVVDGSLRHVIQEAAKNVHRSRDQ